MIQNGVICSRLAQVPESASFFLFGPRGTGKSSWVRAQMPHASYVDLLEDDTYRRLLTRPGSLSDHFGPGRAQGTVIIDEVQKVPALLDEVHRLIELRGIQFALTGSSARTLRREGVNLLAGRALTRSMYPLTAAELGADFNLDKALTTGMLPLAVTSKDPKAFLSSYVRTYLKEEVEQEGLTRRIDSFARFLETASFSQASILSVSQVATDAQVHRKVVEDYFSILRDLLLSYELPVFSRRAKRELLTKRKFYFFDTGLFQTLRPKGPLDSAAELAGPAFETLCVQELMALNHDLGKDYAFSHWRTRRHEEVDLVLYGEHGFKAFEFKSGARMREQDFKHLALFAEDYPEAQRVLVYGGTEARTYQGVSVVPAEHFFRDAAAWL